MSSLPLVGLLLSGLSPTFSFSESSLLWTPRLDSVINKQQYYHYKSSFPRELLSAISNDDHGEIVNGNRKNNGDVNDENIPEIFFFNSKSRLKEVFKTIEPKKVSMYTCGPTVYDYAHVGNFRAFLTYDLIKRVLTYFGYDVTHVCNLTDVDDKIIARAKEKGLANISDLTLTYEKYFFQDLKALNTVLADQYPRATEHISEMMDMILELAAKDLAYETEDGSWYFATSNKIGYGQQLVQLNQDEMEVSTELIGNSMKRDVRDFALWKAFKENSDREDASWELPGKIQKGRPGWHLECSAMARKFLGDTIDLHGGGCDLQFPHHENEIAQSEGVTGRTFCNCWVHNGFVNINEEKMSKSLGNFLTLRKACPNPNDVRAFRFFVMTSQYRKQLNFSSQAIAAAKKSLKRIDKVMNQIEKVIKINEIKLQNGKENDSLGNTHRSELERDVSKAMTTFEAALLNDLSMPCASASLFELIKAAEIEFKRAKKAAVTDLASDERTPNDVIAKLDLKGLKSVQNAILQMDRIFGIFYNVPLTKETLEETETNIEAPDSSNLGNREKVMELVAQRTNAKKLKDWELADFLRTQIHELGFSVKDVKGKNPIVTEIE